MLQSVKFAHYAEWPTLGRSRFAGFLLPIWQQ